MSNQIKLNDDELNFLIKRTKLKKANLLSLIDNERDFNLVVEAVSKQKISKVYLQKIIGKFTLPFCVKFLFYNHNQKECDILTLKYILETMLEVIPEVQKENSFKKVPDKINENMGKYCFIVSGIFRDELNDAKLKWQDYLNYSVRCLENKYPFKNSKDIFEWSESLNLFAQKNKI